MNTDGRKMKLLTLKKIFEEQTDAEHCLTANQLVEKLNEVSIPAERKGIYDDIKVLNYFFKPADKRKEARATRIEKDEEGRGYYLENRLFSVADLKLMIDAIQSSKFLSEAKTMELIEALETLCSRHQARGLKRQVIVTNRVKNMNTNIHNNVGHVNYAIENDVQLKFKYFDYDVRQERVFRKKGGFYVVSPYALVYTDDNYYLLAYDAEKDKIMNFRVDRMVSMGSTSMPREGTTRKPRLKKDGTYEQHSVDYFFIERSDFEGLICKNGFLEYADVKGDLYGTPLSYLKKMQNAGIDIVILNIENDGAAQVKDTKLIPTHPCVL